MRLEEKLSDIVFALKIVKFSVTFGLRLIVVVAVNLRKLFLLRVIYHTMGSYKVTVCWYSNLNQVII